MTQETHGLGSVTATWESFSDGSAPSTVDGLTLTLTCRCGAVSVRCWRFDAAFAGRLDDQALGLIAQASLAAGRPAKVFHSQGFSSDLPMNCLESSTKK